MKKLICILCTIALMLSVFTACAQNSGTASSEPAKESSAAPSTSAAVSSEAPSASPSTADTKKYVIGFSDAGFTDLYSKFLADEMQAYAKTLPNVELKVLDSELDAQKQISTIETFLTDKVDAIITEPLQGSETGIDEANKANIPVVAVTIYPASKDVKFVYVGTREQEVGEIQGKYLADKLPQGAKVCVLLGNLGATNTNARWDGLQKALFDVRKDVTLLDKQSASWETPKAMAITEDWIQKFPKIDAIVSQSDQMLLGALEALKSAKRLKDTMLIGMDANEPGVNAIKSGEITLSIFQDPKLQAITALDTMLKILKGETTEQEIWTPLTPVTKDNVDTFKNSK